MTGEYRELDATIQTFWDAAQARALRFQKCECCGYVRWPPAGVCPECLHRSSSWVEVEGRGTLWSFVVYHRAYRDDLAPFLPYVVGLVELECGVRLVSHVVDIAPAHLAIGQAVQVDFRPIFGGAVAPVFTPVAAQQPAR